MKRILIVDDSHNWVRYHYTAVKEIFQENVEIDTAFSAQQGNEKITAAIDEPYDIILTDMQMEPDFIPLYAGEWFIKQIQFLNEYKNTKIFIISAASNIKQIAERYGVSYIPKYKCNEIDNYLILK